MPCPGTTKNSQHFVKTQSWDNYQHLEKNKKVIIFERFKYSFSMKYPYIPPVLEIWTVHFEKNILSGENNSSEPIGEEGDDIFG